MPAAETSRKASLGKCECGKEAVTKVDCYGIPGETQRCRECYERECARRFREATRR